MTDKPASMTEIKWVEGAGVYKVAEARNIEAEMKRGWRPLGMFRDLVTEERRETKRTQEGYYREEWVYTDKERMCCLMVLDSSLMVQGCEARVAEANTRAHGEMMRREAAEREKKAAEETKAKAEAECQAACVKFAELEREHCELAAKAHTLESDLAAVRKAIGDRQWREITGR